MTEATHQMPDTPNGSFALERPNQQRVQENRELQEIAVTTLTDSKRQRVCEEWNDTTRAYPQRGVHELFEVRRALAALPTTRLINGYGPTESTTFTCCYPIPRELSDRVASIPIGRPIGNTRVYVLDDRLEPVPIGVPGELYVGGDGLARGYRHRPELTAERFIAADAMIGRAFRKVFKRLVCNVCVRTGWTLPASVRSFYVLEIYIRALRNYSPRVFDGRAVYFKCMTQSSHDQERWKNLMKDGLEAYEVPGDHMQVVNKEHAAPWAERLKFCISKIQTPLILSHIAYFTDKLSAI